MQKQHLNLGGSSDGGSRDEGSADYHRPPTGAHIVQSHTEGRGYVSAQ